MSKIIDENNFDICIIDIKAHMFWIWITRRFDVTRNASMLSYGEFDGYYHTYIGFIIWVSRSRDIKWYVGKIIDENNFDIYIIHIKALHVFNSNNAPIQCDEECEDAILWRIWWRSSYICRIYNLSEQEPRY